MKIDQNLASEEPSNWNFGHEGAQMYVCGMPLAKTEKDTSRLTFLPAIIFGTIFGLLSICAALLLGESIWVGLLYHSVFGLIGTAVFFGFLLRLTDRRRAD